MDHDLPDWFWDELAAAAGWRRRPWPEPVPAGLGPAGTVGYLIRPWPGPGRGGWLLVPAVPPPPEPPGASGAEGAGGTPRPGENPAGRIAGNPAWESLLRRAARLEGARLVTCLAWQPLGDLATHNRLVEAGFIPVNEPVSAWRLEVTGAGEAGTAPAGSPRSSAAGPGSTQAGPGGPPQPGLPAPPAAPEPVRRCAARLTGWRMPFLEPPGCPPVTREATFWEAVDRRVVGRGRGRVWVAGRAGALAVWDGGRAWVFPLEGPEAASAEAAAPGAGAPPSAGGMPPQRASAGWAARVRASLGRVGRAGRARAPDRLNGAGLSAERASALLVAVVRDLVAAGSRRVDGIGWPAGTAPPVLPGTVAAGGWCLGHYDAWPAGPGGWGRAVRGQRPRRL